MAHLELEPLRHMGLIDLPGALASGRASLVRPAVEIGDLLVEVAPLVTCATITEQWKSLSQRTIEPNVFFEPEFLMPAVRHLPEAQNHVAMLVWTREGNAATLIGFWPMRLARRGALLPFHLGFRSRYASSGAPLLDRTFAVEAASALVTVAIGAGGSRQETALMFEEMALDGAAARALRAAARLTGLGVQELDSRFRACVWRDGAGESAGCAQEGKARRKHRIALAKLAGHGDVRHISARKVEAVRDGLELFLALEAQSWKGARGTAILCNERDAAFYRAMTRSFSRVGQIDIQMIEAGGRTASAGVILRSGGQGWFAKISHDAAFDACSPGAVLAHEAAAGFLAAEDAPALLDSCAQPGHAMVERVWDGRIRVGDLLFGSGAVLDLAARREILRRQLRQHLKSAYYRVRGWPL